MIDQTLVERIRKERPSPLIGVVGATQPSLPYTRQMGIAVGYSLRDYIASKGGMVFTGGVEGVGIDTYTGIMKYCIETAEKEGRMPEDNFFVLIPKHITIFRPIGGIGNRARTTTTIVPYILPSDYRSAGHLSPKGYIDTVIAGDDMDERREYVSAVADILVVVNGGGGTFDEVQQALRRGKRVIALPATGGTAQRLAQYKAGIFDSKGFFNMADYDSPLSEIDRDLLLLADNVKEIVQQIDSIVQRK